MRLLSMFLAMTLVASAFAAQEKKKEKATAPAQLEDSIQDDGTNKPKGYGSPLQAVSEGLQGYSENSGVQPYSSTGPQPYTSRPGSLPFGTPWGTSENTQSTNPTPQSTSTMSTDQLLNMGPNELGNPAQRSAILNSLDAAIKKWEQFSSRGGVGSGVLGQLKEMRASLTKKDEEEEPKEDDKKEVEPSSEPTEPPAPQGASPTETTTSSNLKEPKEEPKTEVTPQPEADPKETDGPKGRDTHPPACNFSLERTDNGDTNNRITIKDINFIDNKDPKTNIASGVTKIRFSNDGKSWQEYSLSQNEILWTTQPNEDGSVTVYMQACDKDGNWGNGSSETFKRTFQLTK